MMPVVFFSINEGLFFWNGHHGLLLDYLFDDYVSAWSDMPDSTHRRMLSKEGEFSREHTLLFTHGHPDHYSRKHLREYVELYDSGIYGAGIPESNLIPKECAPGVSLLKLPGYRVLILSAAHQGKPGTLDKENSALCIETGESWYLHLGDSILDNTMLETLKHWGADCPEAVFANYYHIVPEDQRSFLKLLQARHTFGIHFPFAKNDEYNIKGRLTRFLKNAADPFLKEIAIPEPMSRIL